MPKIRAFSAFGGRVAVAVFTVMVLLAGVLGAAPAQAAASGTIAGTVSAAETGEVVPGACVRVYNLAEDLAGTSCTDAGGAYVVTGLTDREHYRVVAVGPPGANYAPTWVGGVDATSGSDVISPADLTIALQPAAHISGQLLYQDGTAPVSGFVTIHTVTLDTAALVHLDAAGRWSAVVPPGRYTVTFRVGLTQWQYAYGTTSFMSQAIFTATAAQPLVVNDTLLTGSGGNPLPGIVTGRVTDAVTGEPLAGMCPIVFNVGEMQGVPPRTCAHPTLADGTYSLDATGPFQVRVYDYSGEHAPSLSPELDAESRQIVTLDVALYRPGILDGTVVDAETGAPLAGICPETYFERSDSGIGTPICSDADGHWEVTGLAPEPVTVLFYGDANHHNLWAPDASTQAAATVYTAVPEQTTTLPTIMMPSL